MTQEKAGFASKEAYIKSSKLFDKRRYYENKIYKSTKKNSCVTVLLNTFYQAISRCYRYIGYYFLTSSNMLLGLCI